MSDLVDVEYGNWVKYFVRMFLRMKNIKTILANCTVMLHGTFFKLRFKLFY